jgi:hypothetical protein
MRLSTLLATATAAASLTTTATAAETDGAPVRAWTDLAIQTVRETSASDAQAARLYAMVDAAMYDAVNGIDGRREPAIVAPRRNANGSPRAAAAQAAHDVLAGLYPARAGTYDARLAEDLAASGGPGKTRHGAEWGAEVADGVLAARADDGSQGNETLAGGSGPGNWQSATPWTGVQFRNLAPFAIDDPGDYATGGPPALTSTEYASAFNEVKVLGSAANPDASQNATFRFWALANGTGQPPGAWLQVAQDVSASRGLSLADTARLFALESMSMADTVAPTYTAKFVYHSWRPLHAIRQAGTDGNPATDADPFWTPRNGGAGSSPEYWSGHSSFSAAGAASLAGFFCDDTVPFSLTSDSTGETRSYTRFSQAALEAGQSRIYGGLHFPSSNRDGLADGLSVAREVLGTALLRERGPRRDGVCPL